MNRHRSYTSLGSASVICAAASLALMSGASAQTQVKAEARAAPAAQERAVTNVQAETMLEVVTEEGRLQVRIVGDDVQAMLDGKPLPAERVRVDANAIVLLDANLQPIATMNRPVSVITRTGSGAGMTMSGEWRMSSQRVIGVVTNPVDGALAAQLGLEPRSALVISAVVPGRPAEAAGLRPFDVVTAIDGAKPATIETLRAALTKKAVGQPVELAVVRQGSPMRIAVNFTESDADAPIERIIAASAKGSTDHAFSWRATEHAKVAPDVEREMREWAENYWVRVASEEAAPKLRLHEKIKVDEERRRRLEQSLRAASATLRQLDIQTELPEISFVGPEGRDVALFPRGAAHAAAAAAAERELAVRLREVEARLQRLERMLQTLIELDSRASGENADPETKEPESEKPQTGT